MIRKIFAGLLIGLSVVFFLLSLFSVGAIWFYNPALKEEVLTRLQMIDTELELAQTSLQDASLEIDRTLRIVDAAEETLAELKKELDLARSLFGEVDKTVEDQVLPGLQGTREQINIAIDAVQEIRNFLQQLNNIPFLNLNLPGDELLVEIIDIGFSLDKQIVGIEALAEKASLFLKDASYLMGGDLQETRQNLKHFQEVLSDYDEKLTGWRDQVAELTESLPRWIDTASIVLTVFLLWFAFSQVSLFLQGLDFWWGGNPFRILRRAS
ncbi:MAG: hypothetical protein R6W69_09430 [Anaerolineales bacterium]